MNRKISKAGPWRIGELARATGVSSDTLRHYERKKVLRSERSSNGYREYPENALERVRMIRQALAVGFTLDELSTIFKVFDGGGAPCQQVRTLAAEKLAEVESHLQEVKALRNDLRAALNDWDKRLEKTALGQQAGLLKALAARDSVHGSSTSFLLRKPKRNRKGKNHE
ncbi:MAG TPA: heavy metal-responsive transcriptional regulator [Pyrinomonadaceae bacterium]|jgi:DNA-binding transcriptional MerR regulator|nr:heavy metal-responsive transcriptional regulator [Pyrinomonadaceae bacterium]